MNAPLVTVSGPPGSGKSTAGRIAADRLGLEYRSAGELFRAEAARRSMDLAEFSRYAEEHEEVDRTLDERMLALATPGRLLDARISGALCRQKGIPNVYVTVTAPEAVRIHRLAERDHHTIDEERTLTRARETSERARYRRLYGIELDAEVPDLLLDSSTRPPDELAQEIVTFVRSRGAR